MTDFDVLEPAIDPSNRISFLLDWELTLKCNLDCGYCSTGIYGGHDNTQPHPPFNECLDTIDFMFKYVDLYMEKKPKGIRYVILNIYGGESLYHPNIVEILEQIQEKYKLYQDHWHLTVTTTTNAIVSTKTLNKIIPLIDEFTVSYHSGATEKQKSQFRDNLLIIKNAGIRQKCIVLMHPTEKLFSDSQSMINWLSDNNIKYLPRQLDHSIDREELNYTDKQVLWFTDLYNNKSHNTDISNIKIQVVNGRHDLSDTGRACCGGRQLCKNSNQRTRHFFVENQFQNWYCSVNQFFVYIKQITGEIFVNKDCKMNFNGSIGPIGNLSNSQELLTVTKDQLDTGTQPVIQCKKSRCLCGLCAPKAKNLESYQKIIRKYQQ